MNQIFLPEYILKSKDVRHAGKSGETRVHEYLSTVPLAAVVGEAIGNDFVVRYFFGVARGWISFGDVVNGDIVRECGEKRDQISGSPSRAGIDLKRTASYRAQSTV